MERILSRRDQETGKGTWATLRGIALCAALLGGALLLIPRLWRRERDQKAVPPPDQEAHGRRRSDELVRSGLLCLVPLSIYVLSWSLVVRRLPWAGFWTGCALSVIALVMVLCISSQKDDEEQR